MIRFCVLCAILLLAACGNVKKTLIGDQFGPDPLSIAPRQALVIPQNLSSLPLPVNQKTIANAKQEDLEHYLLQNKTSQKSASTDDLLQKMNPNYASVPAANLEAYQKQNRKAERYLDSLVPNRVNTPILDVEAEQKRIDSGFKGDVPIIMPSGKKDKL